MVSSTNNQFEMLKGSKKFATVTKVVLSYLLNMGGPYFVWHWLMVSKKYREWTSSILNIINTNWWLTHLDAWESTASAPSSVKYACLMTLCRENLVIYEL